MEGKFQSIKILFSLFTLTLFSCKTNELIDTKTVFERALKTDSLSYYFPPILNDSVERKNPNYRDFKQKWYSSALYSFKEPILYTKTDSQTIYRLLWLRSFHEPVCFSVKEYNANYFLNAKILDRQPSFYLSITHEGIDETGKEILDTTQRADRFALIKFDTVKVLTSGQWKEIEKYILKLDFWTSPIADPADEETTDGSNWIIEGLKNNRYHFIDRRNAHGDLKAFAKYLIKLSAIKIEEDDIY